MDLRKDSLNRKLVNALIRLAPSEFSFKELKVDDLPLYNQDDDSNPAVEVKRLKNEISSAHSFYLLLQNITALYPAFLKMLWIMVLDLTAKILEEENQQV